LIDLRGNRILLVDDEALVALHAEDVLGDAGYEVVGPAHRLGDALSLLDKEPFDAAVLDVNLAGEYVWPVAEQLFARKIPFVLLTGFGKGLKLPRCCARAPRLSKPLRADELIDALKGVLRARSPSPQASLSHS
jgi:DNA-binding response OmpR family regulator